MKTVNLLIAGALAALPVGAAFAQADPGAHAGHGAATQTQSQTGAAATAQAGEVQLASKADIKAGAQVVDQSGGAVGTVESVTATGAVVSTGAARVEIPLGSFGKSDKGLVIAMTKAQLEAAAKSG